MLRYTAAVGVLLAYCCCCCRDLLSISFEPQVVYTTVPLYYMVLLPVGRSVQGAKPNITHKYKKSKLVAVQYMQYCLMLLSPHTPPVDHQTRQSAAGTSRVQRKTPMVYEYTRYILPHVSIGKIVHHQRAEGWHPLTQMRKTGGGRWGWGGREGERAHNKA